eukprot:Seg1510.4 transcript_id=Seg1510.4/GoldUCD/mRNA.D3Y31 product="hypothetical protein" protein_id=Seg1510.4/GoldUCD/D3Y31
MESTVEESEQTSFILHRGKTKRKDGSEVSYYQCNRTGKYRTCKIDSNCTATVKVTQDIDGHASVEGCYTHYGHQKSIGHIWLSKKQKQDVASKLAKGVTKERILDDIRSSVQGADHTGFQRHHLIGKEEIKNIRNEFGLHDVRRKADDQTSLLSWIQEWREIDSNPVLYYKLHPTFCTEI